MFQQFASDAVARLSYLYPAATFTVFEGRIEVVDMEDSEVFRRDISYTVYRTKIAAEGRHLRDLMHMAVLRR